MRIALITSDDRQEHRRHEREQPEFHPAMEALMQGFAALGGEVEVHVISCLQKPVRSPAKLADNIFFHALTVPKVGWLRTGYQGCIRAVRRKLKELRPDIVHGQGTERECAISAVFSGFPNVLTVHGNMRLIAQMNHARPLSFLWCAAKLEPLTLQRTDGVVCITDYTHEAVKDLVPRTWLVPNAVDQRFFDLQPADGGKRTLLCVGAICLRKNQNRLIAAIDRVKRPEGFELHFYGRTAAGTPYSDTFLKLVAERPWCRFLDFADRDKIRQAFARASGLVLASFEDNCPMVVLEAMAAGIPVAAAAVGGVPELISNGKTGLLFNPENVDEMAAAVSRLIDSPPYAEAARREAAARFHPLVIARRHLDIYREVLAAR